MVGARAAVFAVLGTAGTFKGFLSPVLGSSSTPSFSFHSSSNRFCSGASAGSGSAVALSGAHTPIGFDYNGLSVVNASAWQSIGQNGYFTNSAPIHGMLSFLCELFSESILDKVLFYTDQNDRALSGSTVHPNNYEYSTLRAMLNGLNTDVDEHGTANGNHAGDYVGKGFLDVAFTAAEKTPIATTALDNTADKIFALSYDDLLNTSYGFDGVGQSGTRYGVPTDYARALGCYLNGSNTYWWSRSPWRDDNRYAYEVGPDGYLGTAPVDYGIDGVRPALTVSLG